MPETTEFDYMLKPGIVVIGQRGRYRIIRRLKIGGQVVIWHGKKIGDEFDVIIKEPKRFYNTQLLQLNLEMFKTGKNILKQITCCPGVEKYIDECSGFTEFLVTYYHRGIPLKPMLNKKPLDWRIAMDIAIKLLRSISCIHKENIVHRDIKPKNILYDGENTVLIDFNTAKRFYQGMTLDSAAIYSRGGYTAPEQATRTISLPQSDLWSFGATMYYILTGVDPVPKYIKNYPEHPLVVNISNVVKGIDEYFAEAIMACLKADYRARPSTADEVLLIMKYGKRGYSRGTRIVIKGIEIPIMSKEIIIGRSKNVDVVLDDRYDPLHYISRRHARIFLGSDGNWYIQDLGSLNKTAVYRAGFGWRIVWRGYKVPSEPFRLRNGDIIAIVFKEGKGPYLTLTFYER
ncbi:MAG: hypothetical protein DRO04_03225 [Candidatus Iainarchaeum archaeon]|uniref:Non-specific serine/threonine protein kinase n=1 Tax=Candidatus Iainarchaeum sp. TaxID=3101447 RepID=A0A497JGY8_9ARCH|nr:MAG: hypothetical protein DRO04_03225 [Candidatus Diapherotrites archaeon]